MEVTLYHDAVHARVVAPLRGAAMDADRVDLGGGLSLVRGDRADAPPEAVWPDPLEPGAAGEPAVLCVLERDAPAAEGITAAAAAERFAAVVTALRLWAPGAVGVGAPGWRRADEGRWQPLPLGMGGDVEGGEAWYLPAGEEAGLGEFFAAVDAADPPRTVAWALARFEMGPREARTPRRCPTTCWRCGRCSTPRATPARRASPSGWPLCARRRAGASWCSDASRPPSGWSAT